MECSYKGSIETETGEVGKILERTRGRKFNLIRNL